MLNCATTKSQNANSFFGLAIGFTVLAGAYSVGNISGAAFNPAVGTGPAIVDVIFNYEKTTTYKYLWIYWLAPLSGATFASAIFRITNTKEYISGTAIASGVPTKIPDYVPVSVNETM